ncbi:MAG: dienelactone hydrolase family protein [Phycisphaerae bacterium]
MRSDTGRRKLVGLVLALGLVVGGAVASGQQSKVRSPADVAKDFQKAYQTSDYEIAAIFGEELVEITGGDAVVLYNLARVYAKLGRKEDAIKTLRRSAEKGFGDAALARRDADLAKIRLEPGFAEAVALMQSSQDKRLNQDRQQADKSKPLIVLPPEHDPEKPSPLVVVLHPNGGSAEWMADKFESIAAEFGAILLAPRAVNDGGGGYAWGTVDETDAILMASLDKVRAEYKINSRKIVLAGFAQGGYMAFSLGMRHAKLFRAVIPIGGLYHPQMASHKGIAVKDFPKFYIMVGRSDPDYDSNKLALDTLRKAGLPVELKFYPGVGKKMPPDTEHQLRKALSYSLNY